MIINADQTATLTADNIRSHVYDEGRAFLELATGTPGQSITIWMGRDGTDLAEEVQALRKLAKVATVLAAGLASRAALPPSDNTGDTRWEDPRDTTGGEQ